MPNQVKFKFEKARRITPKSETEKYQPISIRLHPQVIAWAQAEAKKRGVGDRTIIN